MTAMAAMTEREGHRDVASKIGALSLARASRAPPPKTPRELMYTATIRMSKQSAGKMFDLSLG